MKIFFFLREKLGGGSFTGRTHVGQKVHRDETENICHVGLGTNLASHGKHGISRKGGCGGVVIMLVAIALDFLCHLFPPSNGRRTVFFADPSVKQRSRGGVMI